MEEQEIIVFAGPTGVGKSTIMKYLKDNFSLRTPICYTTRAKRLGEKDPEYVFVSPETFTQYEQEGKFFFTTGHGNRYGYLKSFKEAGPLMIGTSYKNALRLAQNNSNVQIIALAYQNIHKTLANRMIERDGNLDNYEIRLKHGLEDYNNYFSTIKALSSLVIYTDCCGLTEMTETIKTYLQSQGIIEKGKEKVLK